MPTKEPGGVASVAIPVTTSARVLNWTDEKGCRGYFECTSLIKPVDSEIF